MLALKDSNTPGLLGLNSMRSNHAVLDTHTNILHFLPDNKWSLLEALPNGTKSLPLEPAPSGHLVLPCCEYTGQVDQESLSLHTTGRPGPRTQTSTTKPTDKGIELPEQVPFARPGRTIVRQPPTRSSSSYPTDHGQTMSAAASVPPSSRDTSIASTAPR